MHAGAGSSAQRARHRQAAIPAQPALTPQVGGGSIGDARDFAIDLVDDDLVMGRASTGQRRGRAATGHVLVGAAARHALVGAPTPAAAAQAGALQGAAHLCGRGAGALHLQVHVKPEVGAITGGWVLGVALRNMGAGSGQGSGSWGAAGKPVGAAASTGG